MIRTAKLKSTGEIINVHTGMDHNGHTIWLDDATNTEYYSSELEFLPVMVGKALPVVFFIPNSMDLALMLGFSQTRRSTTFGIVCIPDAIRL